MRHHFGVSASLFLEVRSRLSLRSGNRSISRPPSTCRRLERLASRCRQECSTSLTMWSNGWTF